MRALFFCAALAAATPAAAQQERLVERGAPDSALATALAVLRHLAEGNIEEAAVMSNSPRRRFQVLSDYRRHVGDEEFKRVFGRYLAAGEQVKAEIALGPRRLLVWDLGEPEGQIAGQYYVEIEGKFLLDDVPSAERAQLRRVLQGYRSGKLK